MKKSWWRASELGRSIGRCLGGSGRHWEAPLYVDYVSGRPWEAPLYVYYVSGKLWEAQFLTDWVNRVGPLKKDLTRMCGLGGVWEASGRTLGSFGGFGKLNYTYFTYLGSPGKLNHMYFTCVGGFGRHSF